MRTISEADAIFRFKKFIAAAGGQTKAAKDLGLSVSYVNDVFNGRRGLSRKVQAAIGIRKVAEIRYEVVDE